MEEDEEYDIKGAGKPGGGRHLPVAPAVPPPHLKPNTSTSISVPGLVRPAKPRLPEPGSRLSGIASNINVQSSVWDEPPDLPDGEDANLGFELQNKYDLLFRLYRMCDNVRNFFAS